MTVMLKSDEIDRSRGQMFPCIPTPVSSIILVLYLFSAEVSLTNMADTFLRNRSDITEAQIDSRKPNCLKADLNMH